MLSRAPCPDRGGIAPPITPSRCPPARAPRRLVRSRKKGSKTPEGAFFAGRGSLLSNPFQYRHNAQGKRAFSHSFSVKLCRRWLKGSLGALTLERLGYSPNEIDALTRRRAQVLAYIEVVRGADIECWCPLTSRWCHVDTILELANAPDAVQ